MANPPANLPMSLEVGATRIEHVASPVVPRVKYADQGPMPNSNDRPLDPDTTRPSLNLRRSPSRVSFLSIRTAGRRRSVDPSLALPPQFRTVSFAINEANRNGSVKQGISSTAIKTKTMRRPKKESAVESEMGAIEYHKTTIRDLVQRYSSSADHGLSASHAAQQLKTVGRNIPSPPKSRWLQQAAAYLFGGFGTILFIASVLVFISWKPLGNPNPAVANLALAIVLALVWLMQAAFSFWQDFSSSRVMASISQLLPEQCIVIRDGNQLRVDGRDIVPGDVLRITLGNKLPADVRFLQVSSDARFDRSILTGEAVPLLASVDTTDDNYLETANVGLAGTHCVSGSASGLVVSTGDHTVFGKIAKLTSTPKGGMTPLQKEILYFVLCIASVMIFMVILVIAVWSGWLRRSHPDFITIPALIVSCVSVAVAFIPEGLPIAVTASLTIVANIMRKNKILCKSLKTVETLGAVNVICSDKTGTLTRNQMIVTDFLVGKNTYSAAKNPGRDSKGIHHLATVGAVCNDAEFDIATMKYDIADRKVNGDATDTAILRFSEFVDQVSSSRSRFTSIFKIAFNSKSKFAINVVVDKISGGGPTLMIKGAPDILIARCTSYMDSQGSILSLSDPDRHMLEATKNFWSSQGKRVILLAYKPLARLMFDPAEQPRECELDILTHSADGLVLSGLVGIVDPPRPEIPEVVKTLRGAGIRVFMVTGDFKLTAQAIAAECGIITAMPVDIDDISDLDCEDEKRSQYSEKPRLMHKSIVLSGADVEKLDDHMWNRLVEYEEVVFARTTPDHKLKIVTELQYRELTVAITGDGVNDAPSLKAADIGIAMGSGSDIAIEAADMVLLESFAAIVEAVKYGRVVYDNLKKTIAYLLPAGSFSEFWPVMTNVWFGLPQILSSFLMIIVCCCTDAAAATAMAYEQPEADVLMRPPRNAKKDRLVDWRLVLQAYGFVGILETVSSFAMAYWHAQRRGLSFSQLWFGFGAIPDGMTQGEHTAILNSASAVYFVNLVVMQWFVLFALRTRRLSVVQHRMNWFLLPAIGFALVFAIFWLYVPAFHGTLQTATVAVEYWFLPMGFGMVILLLDEGRKYCVRRWPAGFLARIAW